MKQTRKRILVLTTTFPRWRDDVVPPFVFNFSSKLTSFFDVTVLAPHYPGAKTEEVWDSLKVIRFKYFISRQEKLCYGGGIFPNITKNKLLILQIPFLIICEFLVARRLIKKKKFDMIHAHWIIPQGIVAVLIKKIYKIPYIVTSHGTDIRKPLINSWVTKLILQNADGVIAASNSIKSQILKQIRHIPGVSVFPMGVDLNIFGQYTQDTKIRQKYGMFILFVGRLNDQKGLVYLIKAMSTVLRVCSELKLLIIGEGNDRLKYETLVGKLGLKRNIIFLGAVTQNKLVQFYSEAETLINPTLSEGFGLVLIEAMACGCPSIASNVGGIVDIVTDGETGLLCEPGNSKDLAEKIIYLLKMQKLREKLAINGKKQVKKFDLDNSIKQFRKMVLKIIMISSTNK